MTSTIAIIETQVSFTIKGRALTWKRTDGNGKRRFTNKAIRDYENVISHIAKGAMRGKMPFEGAVGVEIEVIHEIPKSWSKHKQRAARLGHVFNTAPGDWDNYGKAYSDAMNLIVYKDDKQIVRGNVTKNYGLEDRVNVTISVFQQGEGG